VKPHQKLGKMYGAHHGRDSDDPPFKVTKQLDPIWNSIVL